MKINTHLLFPLVLCLVISCETKSPDKVATEVTKRVALGLNGFLNITDSNLEGRLEENDNDAVIFVRVNKSGALYADGVFFPQTINEPLDLIGDGEYQLIVFAYKKGTGSGLFQNNGNVFNSSGALSVTNNFVLDNPQNFSPISFDALNVYNSADSSSYGLVEFPELDGYYLNTRFNSDTVTDGEEILLTVERRSAAIEVIANNFTAGEISIELDASSVRSNPTYSLNYPNDSSFHMVSLAGDYQNANTKISINDGSGKELIFSDNLRYYANKVKRFEIDVASANPNSPGISVMFSDLPFERGDTVAIGG